MKTVKNKTASFLFPNRLIKSKNFSKKDVRKIKDNLAKSVSNVYLIVSITITVLVGILFIFMSTRTEQGVAEQYGLLAFIGMITVLAGGFISIGLIVASKFLSGKKYVTTLLRIANIIFYLSLLTYMLFALYSDAEKGFIVQEEALSASVILITILLLIQPAFWIDAMILDIGTSIGLLAMAIYCLNVFGMKAIHYYAMIAIMFPVFSYVIISLLFYAEGQRYEEYMENERLHNNAYYDSLTQCKNRYALTDFLKENQSRWVGRENINLLIVLFDIDDFRLYNSQFSHLGGDYCLKAICESIRNEFKSPNLDFFRYGGEEFLLFFELEEENEAPIYLERVRHSISNLDITAPKGAPKNVVTISVGGLLLNNIKSFSFEEEMKTVDGYLYKAKESGKDAVCYNGSIMH